MSDYKSVLKTIKSMDQGQLIELFHDILEFGCIEDIEKITEAAGYVVENYQEKSELNGEHESADWRRLDDAQRYADIKSTQDSWK